MIGCNHGAICFFSLRVVSDSIKWWPLASNHLQGEYVVYYCCVLLWGGELYATLGPSDGLYNRDLPPLHIHAWRAEEHSSICVVNKNHSDEGVDRCHDVRCPVGLDHPSLQESLQHERGNPWFVDAKDYRPPCESSWVIRILYLGRSH